VNFHLYCILQQLGYSQGNGRLLASLLGMTPLAPPQNPPMIAVDCEQHAKSGGGVHLTQWNLVMEWNLVDQLNCQKENCYSHILNVSVFE